MVPRLLPGSHESPEAGFHGGYRNIHRTAGGLPAPRASHPCVVLTRPPPLPETGLGLPCAESRRLWLDGSIIVPIAGHRRAGCRPALSAGRQSLSAGAGHGAAAEVAHAHRNDNGNVSDEWTIRLSWQPRTVRAPAGAKDVPLLST